MLAPVTCLATVLQVTPIGDRLLEVEFELLEPLSRIDRKLGWDWLAAPRLIVRHLDLPAGTQRRMTVVEHSGYVPGARINLDGVIKGRAFAADWVAA